MSSPPTLLLADDSLTIQRVLALTFADQPVRLVVARDGQDAINLMVANPPDLVLADTNMPCVDGYEVARWVRQQPHLARVPVLLLAGVTDPVDEQRLHDSGANGVLEKPFEPSHVISRVKELLGMKGAGPAQPERMIPPPDPQASRPRPPAPPVDANPATVSAPADTPQAHAQTAADEEPGGRASHDSDDPFADVDARMRGDDVAAEDADVAAAAAGDRRVAEATRAGEALATGARDWFDHPAPSPQDPPPSAGDRDLAAEMGLSGGAFYGEEHPGTPGPGSPAHGEPTPARPRAMPLSAQATADVFEKLLAAEQGDSGALDAQAGTLVVQAAAPEITEEMVAHIAGRLHERLAGTVQASIAGETRAAMAASLPALVEGLATAVRGAAAEAVPPAVSEAVQALVQEQLAAMVRQTVHDAVAAALPGAVADALGASLAGDLREVVHETAERLVRDEIARIRGDRG